MILPCGSLSCFSEHLVDIAYAQCSDLLDSVLGENIISKFMPITRMWEQYFLIIERHHQSKHFYWVGLMNIMNNMRDTRAVFANNMRIDFGNFSKRQLNRRLKYRSLAFELHLVAQITESNGRKWKVESGFMFKHLIGLHFDHGLKRGTPKALKGASSVFAFLSACLSVGYRSQFLTQEPNFF